MNRKLYICILIIPIILSGCIGKKNEEKEFKKRDLAPDSLREVSSKISEILKDTEDIEKIIDKTYVEEIDEDNKENKQQNKEEDKNKEDKKQEEDPAEEEKQNSPEKENQSNNAEKSLEKEKEGNKEKEVETNIKLEEKWEDIYKKIEKVHESWNSYEPEGTKKGMTAENSDAFRNSLNKLTKSIESKNFMEVYDFGSQSLSTLDPLFAIYKDEIIGDINKLKYYTYRAYLFSLKKETGKSSEILKSSDEVISSIRIKLDEDEEKLDLLEKASISINDMRKALKEDSIKLNRIKRDIAIKNLEELGDK